MRLNYQILLPNPPQIDDVDLCRLLFNLLDNALAGCADAPESNRRGELVIRQNGAFLFFSCTNTCNPARLKRSGEKFLSTKPDAAAHGLGIAMMARIAKRYNGTLRTAVDGDRFTTSIQLCPEVKKEES